MCSEKKRRIEIEVSARHVHLSHEHLEYLFGPNYTLSLKKHLSQTGQYACRERLTIIGERGQLPATILGPIRPHTQIEVSASDARILGITAPQRESGHIAGSGSCIVKGPQGELHLQEGVIIAKRHIHMNPSEATAYHVDDGNLVQVEISGSARSLIFKKVLIRVDPLYKLALHIDTDEANAAGVANGDWGTIIG